MSKLILASLLVLGVTAFAEKPEYCGNYPPDRSPLECRDGDDSQVVIIEDDGTVGEVPEICKLGYFTEDTLPEECRGFDAPELPSGPLDGDTGPGWIDTGDGGNGFPELPPELN